MQRKLCSIPSLVQCKWCDNLGVLPAATAKVWASNYFSSGQNFNIGNHIGNEKSEKNSYKSLNWTCFIFLHHMYFIHLYISANVKIYDSHNSNLPLLKLNFVLLQILHILNPFSHSHNSNMPLVELNVLSHLSGPSSNSLTLHPLLLPPSAT